MSFIIIYPLVNVDKSLPIAGFDLDVTLIEPKSKNKHKAKNPDDWKWVYDNTPKALTQLSRKYRIVAFTNQGEKTFNEKEFKQKISNIQHHLPFLEVRVSHGKDNYRKPNTGMWLDEDIKDENSFFVGDAAGREDDFSASDYFFAKNLSLTFYTPEEYFLGHSSPSKEKPTKNIRMFDYQHIICMVGFPGSGKSTFARELSMKHDNLAIVGNDDKKEKIVKDLDKYIKEGKSCIIDATNLDMSSRKFWIDFAHDRGLPIRCFKMTTTYSVSIHLNSLREKRISDIVYRAFKKKYVKPAEDEGFEDIVDITIEI